MLRQMLISSIIRSNSHNRSSKPLRTATKELVFQPLNTAFLSVIISLPIPPLPPERPFWAQRVRLSTGNAGEVLRGDQGTEIKKRILAARNWLFYKINMLSFFNHCTYESSFQDNSGNLGLPVEIKEAESWRSCPFLLCGKGRDIRRLRRQARRQSCRPQCGSGSSRGDDVRRS